MKGANTARGRRREKRRGSGKGSRQDTGRIENHSCRVQGRTYLFSVAALQYNAFNLLLSTFGDRAIAVGDLYAEWRPISIKVSMAPVAQAALTNFVLGACYPDAIVTIPTTPEEVCDLPAFAQGNGTFGCPYPVLKLDRGFWSKRPTDWLYTQSAPVTGTFIETCGQIIVGNPDTPANVITQRFLLEWELEFRSMLDPTVSAAKIRASVEEEYKSEFPPLNEDLVLLKNAQPSAVSAPAVGVSSPARASYAMRCRPA